jgi:shikimate kinase
MGGIGVLGKTAKSIIFIGFMGVGKTTIGKLVAKQLNRDFIDIDEEIEKEYNLPITKIFDRIGERAFREREKSLIKNLAGQNNKIISVGGGAFLQEEIRKLCLASCIVIFLDLSFTAWKERLDLILESRPVLQGKSMEEMEELFYKRQEIYSNHHLKINVDNKDANTAAAQVVTALKDRFGISV